MGTEYHASREHCYKHSGMCKPCLIMYTMHTSSDAEFINILTEIPSSIPLDSRTVYFYRGNKPSSPHILLSSYSPSRISHPFTFRLRWTDSPIPVYIISCQQALISLFLYRTTPGEAETKYVARRSGCEGVDIKIEG